MNFISIMHIHIVTLVKNFVFLLEKGRLCLLVSFYEYNIKLQVKDINARLERIEPKVRSSDALTGEMKPVHLNPKKSSPKAKSSSREISLFGG